MTMARQRIGYEVQRPLFIAGLHFLKYGPVPPHQVPALLAPPAQPGLTIQPIGITKAQSFSRVCVGTLGFSYSKGSEGESVAYGKQLQV